MSELAIRPSSELMPAGELVAALQSQEEKQNRLRELDAKRDSFGNRIRLLWDPVENTVHLGVDPFLVEVNPERASKAFDDHIPELVKEHGWDDVLSALHKAA